MQLNEMITSKEEKAMLIYGLTRVMHADGSLSDSEFAFLEQISLALDCEKVDAEENKVAGKKMHFDDSRTCMFFLTQAVQLCYVDGKYDVAEKNELKLMCEEMGISESALLKVENWVEEGIAWNNRGMNLLDLK